MKKISFFTKRAVLRIILSFGLLGYIYSLFIAPGVFIFGGNAYFINLVWNTEQTPEIWTIGTSLTNPKIVAIDGSPLFLKDESRIFSIIGCPNTPATGFDAVSFQGIGRGTGGAGIILKDNYGTYTTASLEEGIYGRPNCKNGIALPYKKI